MIYYWFTNDLVMICYGCAKDVLWISLWFIIELLWIYAGFTIDVLLICLGCAIDLVKIYLGFAMDSKESDLLTLFCMNSKESELPYIKFTNKDHTLLLALRIPGTPRSLNYSISNLRIKIKLCSSLNEFNEFRGVLITLYQIYE